MPSKSHRSRGQLEPVETVSENAHGPVPDPVPEPVQDPVTEPPELEPELDEDETKGD